MNHFPRFTVIKMFLDSAQHSHPLDLAGHAILLAYDGSPESIAAARVAATLEFSRHAVIHVVYVVDTSPAPIPPPLDLALALGDELAAGGVHTSQAKALHDELSHLLDRPIEWPVRLTLGVPASAIAREARRLRAALVITGLRHHGRIDRVLRDETVVKLMQRAPCAVLAVTADAVPLFARTVVAVDFSEASFLAARAVSAIVGPKRAITLAYVPPLGSLVGDEGEKTIHELGVAAGFARIASDLQRPEGQCDSVVLNRTMPADPADLLLEYAGGVKADLIAAGSARHTRMDQWLLGSVSTELVRDGRVPVLIVPPSRVDNNEKGDAK